MKKTLALITLVAGTTLIAGPALAQEPKTANGTVSQPNSTPNNQPELTSQTGQAPATGTTATPHKAAKAKKPHNAATQGSVTPDDAQTTANATQRNADAAPPNFPR